MPLSSNAEATSLAQAILSKYELNSQKGSAITPIDNVGAEVGDYVKVWDGREGQDRVGNIARLVRTWKGGSPGVPAVGTLEFTFGGWATADDIISMLQNQSDIASSFQSLIVGQLQVDDIYARWLDPDGNIDLDKIGDTIDSLADGENYIRQRYMHLSAAGLELVEDVMYALVYRNIIGHDVEVEVKKSASAPAAAFQVEGNIWIDISGTPVTKIWHTNAWVPATDAEKVALGGSTLYRRTKSSSLTADGLVIADNLYINDLSGTYGMVLRTDMSAGHISLSSVVQSSDYRTTSDTEKSLWTAKNTVFGQASIPTSKAIGDMWVDTDDQNKTYIAQCVGADEIKAGEWVLARDGEVTQLRTDIGTGTLCVSQYTTLSGTWTPSTGVALDATRGIGIYGGVGVMSLRTYADYTNYLNDTNRQIYIGTDGKLYAGAGSVVLDVLGITVDNGSDTNPCLRFTGSGSERVRLYAGSSQGLIIHNSVSGYNAEFFIRAGEVSFLAAEINGGSTITPLYCVRTYNVSFGLTSANPDVSGFGQVYVKSGGVLYYKYYGTSEVKLSGLDYSDVGAAASSHSHSEYLNKNGSVALTSNWNAGSYQITANGFKCDINIIPSSSGSGTVGTSSAYFSAMHAGAFTVHTPKIPTGLSSVSAIKGIKLKSDGKFDIDSMPEHIISRNELKGKTPEEIEVFMQENSLTNQPNTSDGYDIAGLLQLAVVHIQDLEDRLLKLENSKN
jgi:hypothetical protein